MTPERGSPRRAPVRVLIIDDHPIVRVGIIELLGNHDWLVVVDQAADGREGLAKARELRPDIVLLDITLPKLNGLTVAKTLRTEFPGMAVIILSMHGPEHVAEYILESGARGYVCKKVASCELINALETVATGGTYFDNHFSQLVVRRCSGQPGGKECLVSPRERDVLVCIAEGLSTKEIADQLGLGVRTVETHRQRLIRKLDIHTTAGLTRFAIQKGLVVLSHNTSPIAQVSL